MSTNDNITGRILVAGGTGRLGTNIVRLLLQRGLKGRAHARSQPSCPIRGYGVEIAEGDLRDQDAVRRAVAGAQTVVSAVKGFAGTKDGSPATIDRDGNRNLIQAASTSCWFQRDFANLPGALSVGVNAQP